MPESGTADILYTLPISRTRIVISKVAALFIEIALMSISTILTVVIGAKMVNMTIATSSVITATVAAGLMALIFGGLALLAGSFTGKKGAATGLAVTIAIANTGVTAATYGAAATVPVIAVNAQGQITSATNTSIAIASSAITDKGLANGVASLDSGGTVPLSQIPASIQGGLIYQGTWNATTNTPTLTSSVGTKGHYYVVSVAGTTNLDGITDWNVGDLAIFNGSVWEQVDNTDAVTSVNGYTGTVVLTYSDVGAANAGANTNITSMSGLTGGIATPEYIDFDTSNSVARATGRLWWDNSDGIQTLNLGMAGSNATMQIGRAHV